MPLASALPILARTAWLAWNSLDVAWEDGFATLEKYVAREGNAGVPDTHIEDGFNLGTWVGTQRSRRGSSSLQRISRLESLPGWVWDVRDSGWEDGFAALSKYVEREGHTRISQSHLEDGFSLGRWVNRQRSRREGLSPEQVSRLEGLTVWVWSSLEAAWEDGFAALEEFVQREGHARVPQSHAEGAYRLGSWVINLRARPERLSLEQKARLEALPGWAWTSDGQHRDVLVSAEKGARRDRVWSVG